MRAHDRLTRTFHLTTWHGPTWRQLTRSLAILLSLSFISPTLSWAFDMQTYEYAMTTQLGGPGSRELADAYRVSGKSGKVAEAHFAPGERAYIFIQDLHCNPEVQTNIRSMLNQILARHRNLRLVAVEGAEGILPTLELAKIDNTPGKRAVTDYFMREGRLTGPDCLAICDRPELELFGAEHEPTYAASLKLVQEFSTEANRGVILEMLEMADAAEARVFNPNLLAFERKRNAFLRGQSSPEIYHAQLLSLGKDLQLGLLPESLRELSRIRPLDYHEQQLQDEYLEKQIRDHLAKSPDEKKFLAYRRYLELCDRLLGVSASHEDRRTYAANPSRLSLVKILQALQDAAGEPGWLTEEEAAELDQTLPKTAQFYDLAEKRDQILFNNATRRLRERGESQVVIVTGGYHTAAMVAQARAQGQSAVVLCPRMERADAGASNYFNLLMHPDQPTGLERMMVSANHRQSAIAVVEALAQSRFVREIFPSAIAWTNRVFRNGQWHKEGWGEWMAVSFTDGSSSFLGRNGREVFVATTLQELKSIFSNRQLSRWTNFVYQPAARIAGMALMGVALIPLIIQLTVGTLTWPVLIAAALGFGLLALWGVGQAQNQAGSIHSQRTQIILLTVIVIGMLPLNFVIGDILSQAYQAWLNSAAKISSLQGMIASLKMILLHTLGNLPIEIHSVSNSVVVEKIQNGISIAGGILTGPIFSGLAIIPENFKFAKHLGFLPRDPREEYGKTLPELLAENSKSSVLAQLSALPRDQAADVLISRTVQLVEDLRKMLGDSITIDELKHQNGKLKGVTQIFTIPELVWFQYAVFLNGIRESRTKIPFSLYIKEIDLPVSKFVDCPITSVRMIESPDKKADADNVEIKHTIVVSLPKFINSQGQAAVEDSQQPLADYIQALMTYLFNFKKVFSDEAFQNIILLGLKYTGTKSPSQMEHYKKVLKNGIELSQKTNWNKLFASWDELKYLILFHELSHFFAAKIPDVISPYVPEDQAQKLKSHQLQEFMDHILPELYNSVSYIRATYSEMITQGRRAAVIAEMRAAGKSEEEIAKKYRLNSPEEMRVSIAEEVFCDRNGMYVSARAGKIYASVTILKLDDRDSNTSHVAQILESAWRTGGERAIAELLKGTIWAGKNSDEINSAAADLAKAFTVSDKMALFFIEQFNDPDFSDKERRFYQETLDWIKWEDPTNPNKMSAGHAKTSRIIQKTITTGLEIFTESRRFFSAPLSGLVSAFPSLGSLLNKIIPGQPETKRYGVEFIDSPQNDRPDQPAMFALGKKGMDSAIPATPDLFAKIDTISSHASETEELSTGPVNDLFEQLDSVGSPATADGQSSARRAENVLDDGHMAGTQAAIAGLFDMIDGVDTNEPDKELTIEYEKAGFENFGSSTMGFQGSSEPQTRAPSPSVFQQTMQPLAKEEATPGDRSTQPVAPVGVGQEQSQPILGEGIGSQPSGNQAVAPADLITAQRVPGTSPAPGSPRGSVAATNPVPGVVIAGNRDDGASTGVLTTGGVPGQMAPSWAGRMLQGFLRSGVGSVINSFLTAINPRFDLARLAGDAGSTAGQDQTGQSGRGVGSSGVTARENTGLAAGTSATRSGAQAAPGQDPAAVMLAELSQADGSGVLAGPRASFLVQHALQQAAALKPGQTLTLWLDSPVLVQAVQQQLATVQQATGAQTQALISRIQVQTMPFNPAVNRRVMPAIQAATPGRQLLVYTQDTSRGNTLQLTMNQDGRAVVNTTLTTITLDEAVKAFGKDSSILQGIQEYTRQQSQRLVQPLAPGLLLLSAETLQQQQSLIRNLTNSLHVEINVNAGQKSVPGSTEFSRLPWDALQAALKPAFDQGARAIAVDFDLIAFEELQRASRLGNSDVLTFGTRDVLVASRVPGELDLNAQLLDQLAKRGGQVTLSAPLEMLRPDLSGSAQKAATEATLLSVRELLKQAGVSSKRPFFRAEARQPVDQDEAAWLADEVAGLDRVRVTTAPGREAVYTTQQAARLDWNEPGSMFWASAYYPFRAGRGDQQPVVTPIESQVLQLKDTEYMQSKGLRKVVSGLVLFIAAGTLVVDAVKEVWKTRETGGLRGQWVLFRFFTHPNFAKALRMMIQIILGRPAAREALPTLLQQQVEDLEKLIAELAAENLDLDGIKPNQTPQTLRYSLDQFVEFKNTLNRHPVIRFLMQRLGINNLLGMYPELFILFSESNSIQAVMWYLAPASTLRGQIARMPDMNKQLRDNFLRPVDTAMRRSAELNAMLAGLAPEAKEHAVLNRELRDMKFTIAFNEALDWLQAKNTPYHRRLVLKYLVREMSREDVDDRLINQLDLFHVLVLMQPFEQKFVNVGLDYNWVVPVSLPAELIDSALRDSLLEIFDGAIYDNNGKPLEPFRRILQRMGSAA